MGRPNFFTRLRAAITDALSGRLVTLTRRDHTPRVTVPTVTGQRIQSALSFASNGDLREIGSVYDLMPATDSHIRGVRRQLIAGITSIPAEIIPVDDSPEAQAAADLCRAAVDAPDSSMRDAITGIVEGDLRGVSLTEILWNEAGEQPRRWTGFRVVPQQRIRYDLETGAVRVALTADDMTGKPVSALPGKFLVTIADRDVPDFASRGVYRSVLSEWFGRLNVSGWEMQCIERHGMPIPIGKYGREPDRVILEEAFANFGAAGSLVVSEGTSVEMQTTAVSTTGSLVHETYLEKSAQRISVAFLGSQQTVTVGTDQGSKASAGVSQLVRRDVVFALWQLVSEVVRRDLFTPLVRMNLGEQYVRLTPQYVPQFDDSVDMATTAAALLTITRELGIEVGKAKGRELLAIPAPEEGEEIITPAAVAPAAAPFTSFGASSAPATASARRRSQLAANKPEPPAKPPRDAGAEITDPIAALLDELGDDGSLESFQRAIDKLEPADVPVLGDKLAAALADGYLGSKHEVRKGRK